MSETSASAGENTRKAGARVCEISSREREDLRRPASEYLQPGAFRSGIETKHALIHTINPSVIQCNHRGSLDGGRATLSGPARTVSDHQDKDAGAESCPMLKSISLLLYLQFLPSGGERMRDANSVHEEEGLCTADIESMVPMLVRNDPCRHQQVPPRRRGGHRIAFTRGMRNETELTPRFSSVKSETPSLPISVSIEARSLKNSTEKEISVPSRSRALAIESTYNESRVRGSGNGRWMFIFEYLLTECLTS
ncbi:hypothetical protein Tco_0906285, partial [Tanacetum coccineum]